MRCWWGVGEGEKRTGRPKAASCSTMQAWCRSVHPIPPSAHTHTRAQPLVVVVGVGGWGVEQDPAAAQKDGKCVLWRRTWTVLPNTACDRVSLMSRRCRPACQLASHSRGECRHHTAGIINSNLLAIEVAHKAPDSEPTQPTPTPNLQRLSQLGRTWTAAGADEQARYLQCLIVLLDCLLLPC